MKPFNLALCALTASLGLGGAAMAQDADPVISWNLGVASEYVFRGVSQTMEDPAIQGGVDITAGKAYLGTWASNVDFGDSTQAEIDFYGGYKPTLGPITLDLGFIYYGYVDAPTGADYSNLEGKLAATVPVGPASVTGGVYYSADGFGVAEESTYYELSGLLPVGPVTVSGAVAAQTYGNGGDYNLWHIGASYTFADHFTFDLRYYDTSEHDFGPLYEDRIVASLKAAF
jgi:uncharacterized protein (TIGR02001 family)